MFLLHANTGSQTANIILNINGTNVSMYALRPLANPESTAQSTTAIIPKGASYKIFATNYHHYEWREYPILSGKNGTLSINTSISDAQLNLKVNKTSQGDVLDGTFTGSNGSVIGTPFTVEYLGNYDAASTVTVQSNRAQFSLKATSGSAYARLALPSQGYDNGKVLSVKSYPTQLDSANGCALVWLDSSGSYVILDLMQDGNINMTTNSNTLIIGTYATGDNIQLTVNSSTGVIIASRNGAVLTNTYTITVGASNTFIGRVQVSTNKTATFLIHSIDDLFYAAP